MTTHTTPASQLRLIECEPAEQQSDWALDDRTRRVGRFGVAQARAVLRKASPPQVLDRDRRAS